MSYFLCTDKNLAAYRLLPGVPQWFDAWPRWVLAAPIPPFSISAKPPMTRSTTLVWIDCDPEQLMPGLSTR